MDIGGTILAAILLVVEIVKGTRQLHDAPHKLLALMEQVEHAQYVLLKVRQADVAYGEEPFQKCLQDLHGLLLCAQDKIDTYQIEPKNKVLEIAKSTFRQGFAKQNLEAEALREHIGELLERLNQLLTVKTGCQIGSMPEVVKPIMSCHPAMDDDTKLKVITLEKTLSQARTLPPEATAVEVPGLISKLNALARASLDDEECTIDLEIADSNSDRFHPFLEEMDHSIPTETGHHNQSAAQKAGYEIANGTKVRFLMGVEENRYLYVIMYDVSEGNHPSLYFPEYATDMNEVTCKLKRHFPDKTKFACDPVHMAITKSEHLRTDVVGKHNLYIVLSCNKIHSETKKPLHVKDIEENIDNGDFVKHFVFDIL